MSESLASKMGKKRADEIKEKLKQRSQDCAIPEVLEFLVDGIAILIERDNGNGNGDKPSGKRLVTIGRWIRIENFGGLHVAVIILALAIGGIWAKDLIVGFLK